jgi:hypothetical protein
MAGRPVVGHTFFAHLPHRCRNLAGATVDVSAANMNPGFFTTTGVTRNAGLQAIVDRRVLEASVATPRHSELRRLRFALVDLTGAAKLAAPEFAGHDELVQGGIGSMAKIACMYAAFQLRFDLEALSRSGGITTKSDLFAAARRLWLQSQKRDSSKLTTLFSTRPLIERLGQLIEIDHQRVPLPPGLANPDLEQIFKATPATTGGMTVGFKGSDRISVDSTVTAPSISNAVDTYVRTTKENLRAVRKLSFAERLFLMLDESDNAAAHSCIENVSFLYIGSALWQSDLYSPARGGGLWEASTHDRRPIHWILPPVPKGAPGSDFVSATAASSAALLTLIAQGRLVSAADSTNMKLLLNKNKPGFGSLTRSFFEEELSALGPDTFFSKLGIANFNNDGAIVERTVFSSTLAGTDTQIRYVLTGFDEPLGENGERLRKLAVELDKCILENNGLLTPATP